MELSEEMQMYLEVAKNCKNSFAERIKIVKLSDKQRTALKRRISGELTENIIRKHLIQHKVIVSETQVFIEGVTDPIDLLSLNSVNNSTKRNFNPDEVDTVLEITNTGVSEKSTRINKKFDKIKKVANDINFAVLVLSERADYPNAVVQERLRKDFDCKVYTLIVRDRYINPFDWPESEILKEYARKTEEGISAITETGDWQGIVNLLLHKP